MINSVLDSAVIIGRHGLIPEPSNDDHLKELFSPVSVIVDHFEAKDKTQTKQQCNDVVQHLFCSGKDGLLGAVAFCLFKAQSFYNKPTTILIYHKLCHAEVLRTLHPHNKNTASLHGGLYHACKESQRNIRDSLYVKSDECQDHERRVIRFHHLQLKSNKVFLDPELTTVYLFKTKGTHCTDTDHLKKAQKTCQVVDKCQSQSTLHKHVS